MHRQCPECTDSGHNADIVVSVHSSGLNAQTVVSAQRRWSQCKVSGLSTQAVDSLQRQWSVSVHYFDYLTFLKKKNSLRTRSHKKFPCMQRVESNFDLT